MSQAAVYPAALEVRQRGRSITGRFTYGITTTIGDRGRRRKEIITPGAFDFAIDEGRRIDALVGHRYDRPLGNTAAGTLAFVQEDEALDFEVRLPSDQPQYMRDTVVMVESGLIGGVSPGFRVPPLDVVPDAEEEIPEPGNPDVTIRRINAAVLFEMSLVTRPAYDETSVEVRSALARLRRNPAAALTL